ncbi:anaphase-promoting complex subunit 5 [Macadamia integrifolia]|uniref:anaphase-promoting complex subunit 5 n=1 Tax=Macadamia integrifolia TaxID=60698 RepID=UPI001C4F29A2|nr:anaphase-promoting complex subunit 5 [Macadamia integrifolia]XP_042497862.1 anaphase-promoting complex subunit 5 [Macadamia integrifolia]XP_042497863.1 anaphase-promoting complex subunit 5 [Macadamia integrifolia]
MAGDLKPVGAFTITPHKVSVCILLQIYAPPAQASVPFPFSSVSQHNRLGLFLLALTKSCDDVVEPTLDELTNQLGEIGGLLNHWLSEHLTRRLSSLASPDDLFNIFSSLRSILGGHETSVLDDDQIILDPNSHLGIFLRRCLLAFNLLSFEAICHLLTDIGIYCKEAASSCRPYELPNEDDSNNEPEELLGYEDMDLETFVFRKVAEEAEARKRARESATFHLHAPKSLFGLVEDVQVPAGSKFKRSNDGRQGRDFACRSDDASRGDSQTGGLFLRTNWQVQGFLREKADLIERHGSSFPLNSFESVLKQLQKLAPELHRVHYLRYLNSLYHHDFPASLENLHCYFDYSAGAEGIDTAPSSSFSSFGNYETALLCLGVMHCHFGHPKQSLEVLTEAVRASQQHNNDTCLAYTLTAICNLLSEVGISSTTGIIDSSHSPVTSIGTSLSIQQQLFVLLRRSLKRAESLKLPLLVASNRLAMAKFNITHVKRALLSFGPKASMKLKTCPSDVCKELRLSSYLLIEFGSDGASLTIDGAFSTAWRKSLQKPMASSVLSHEDEPGGSCDAFQFGSQPSSIPGYVMQLAGASYLLRATAWELYGSAPVARLNALIYATCFSDSSSSADVALAYVKLIQHLAIFKGYKEAFSALQAAEEKFVSLSKSQIQLLKLQLLHERALHRGHLKLAQQVCDEFGALASSVTGVDMELKSEASLRHARTLLAAKQFSQAAAVAQSLFCMCYKFNLQVENATALLLLAEIHKKSGNAVLGLPYVLASLSFCQSFNLDLLEASATLVLAELWLSLGSSHAKRASTLIHRAFPMILGHGGLELRARAFIADAKCYLSDPCFSVSEDPEVVVDSLRQASEELEILEYHELAAEAFYLMAIVFDRLGHLDERENAAASFRNHVVALENPDDDDPLLNGI